MQKLNHANPYKDNKSLTITRAGGAYGPPSPSNGLVYIVSVGGVMRVLTSIAIFYLAVFVASCSWTPNLKEVTGTSEPPAIFVDDVVKRIKCEIYDASQTVLADKLAWTKDWTAKANLSLSVINSGGLTPNVAAVRYVPSAYYNAETATGGKLLSAVQQKFSLGANLTLSESATRTELVVFTVPFGSAKKEDGCDGAATGSELQSNLGIKEWVQTAFAPAQRGLLPPNIAALESKVPGLTDLQNELCSLNPGLAIDDDTALALKEDNALITAACKDKTSEPTDPQALAYELAYEWRAIEPLNDVCVDNFFLKAESYFARGASQSKLFSKLAKTGKIASVKANLKANNGSPPVFNWLTVHQHHDALQAHPNNECRDIDALAKVMNATVRLTAAVKIIRDDYTSSSQSGKKAQSFANGLNSKTLQPLKDAEKGLDNLNTLLQKKPFELKLDLASTYDTLRKGIPGCDIDAIATEEKPKCFLQYNSLIKAASFVVYVEDIAHSSTQISQYIKSFSPGLPIDSLSHTVIFVVTYGAGVTPQWSFINVTTANNPLAMMQGMRTHNLLLAIGPPTENSANIQNQTVANALAPH